MEQPEDSAAPADAPVGPDPAPPTARPVYYPPPLPTSPMAIVGMVLGILAVITMFCYGLPGLIFGIAAIITSRLALVACRRAREEIQGEGIALAGLVTGWIGAIGGLLMVLVMAAYIGFMVYTVKSMPTPTPPTIVPSTAPAAPPTAPPPPAP